MHDIEEGKGHVIELAVESTGNARSVSYTHLDVYKRQRILGPGILERHMGSRRRRSHEPVHTRYRSPEMDDGR